ncbi:glycosyltransferase [Stagnimonas aquatica]|uniref:Glycosyltransferase n=1 Tax=Stagnimonas aquatica TaxID=2689987 RepID=A0A3N0VKZ6_9GAMM|nr:glycosyltransferase family 4 protein [Stagnimonas aquatica]ROH93395.1 glycosyltransferase [Stagnimonas aquatica]
MRILVLSKRQYMGKDLLDDRYGRFYEIPASLASCGHEVIGVALSYRCRDERCYFGDTDSRPGIAWLGLNALPWGVWRYPWQLARIADNFRPDVVWACSDAFHAIFGALFSRATGVPLVIDLYDDFESYAATGLPGVAPAFRAACRRAAGLTVVSRTLRDRVVADYGIQAQPAVVGNGVRRDLFYPRDRRWARAALGLPVDARLVGTAGSLSADRDIGVLFEAFLALAESDPLLHLVVAGCRDGTPACYRHPRIIDLGVLALEQVPELISALDVAVVCNRNSAFGRCCFPQKFHEIAACGTPVVVARVGDVATLLADTPGRLYEPGDPVDLARRIAGQLIAPRPTTDIVVPGWGDWSAVVEQILADVAA